MESSAQNLMNMPSNKKFGYLFTAIFIICATYFLWKNSLAWAIVSVFLAALFILAIVCAPKVLEGLNRVWVGLSLKLGKVVSPIVLSLIFFFLITPVALITRVLGRDVLLVKKRQVSSYWIDKESIAPESFKNQF